ncbi:MAG: hypothetical protein HRU70_05505 [Phycisphaeraceae bacterium]|nr:MAG: hypothetical protein HRU70_05505 [Phycisphaeraceae bacterium]
MNPSWTVWFALTVAAPAALGQSFLGPTPYLCDHDSPWPVRSEGYYLETFEDGALNTPGVIGSGSVTGPGGITDSVDCDDGVIDGLGRDGRSYFGPATAGITFTFNAATFGGRLPQRTGIVWTDGVHILNAPDSIHFEAFDAAGQRLGTISGSHPDGSVNSETAEDRFYGVEHLPGVWRIRIWQTAGCCGIEVDHLQYGFIAECRADFNADGFVDFFDFDAYVECFEGGECPPGASADFDGDGFIDFFDFQGFVDAFETGC